MMKERRIAFDEACELARKLVIGMAKISNPDKVFQLLFFSEVVRILQTQNSEAIVSAVRLAGCFEPLIYLRGRNRVWRYNPDGLINYARNLHHEPEAVIKKLKTNGYWEGPGDPNTVVLRQVVNRKGLVMYERVIYI